MTTAVQVPISDASERAICTYTRLSSDFLTNQFSLRGMMEEIDRGYMREEDYTEENIRARLANRYGDARKFQDVTVPVIMPQVRSALTYMANVFLTGTPIFEVSGDPTQEDAALMMETIVEENSVTAGYVRQLMMFFLDGLKYNLHGVLCEWQQKNVYSVESDPKSPTGAKPKTTIWKGNVIKRLDLYNTFFDPRVHPSEIHSKGEYAGYIEPFSRIALKQLINDYTQKIPADRVKRAFESGAGLGSVSATGSPYSFYIPQINFAPLMANQPLVNFDWMQWATIGSSDGKPKSNIKYTNAYYVTTLFARIMPSDFMLRAPEENTPQVWKFVIVNGSVVLFAERQSNAHNWIPMFFGQPLEDGLDYQTKSFAQNVTDLQRISSAMWNGYIASKRRLIGDRVLYDPLRIRSQDINSREPAAKIPVRPSAYGKPVSEAVYQFPFRDDQTQSLLDGAARVVAFADKVNGQNPAQQGQFVKGNKTREEYNDTMGRGDAGNQLMAMMTEAQVFTPVKDCIKLNILQFQPDGNIYSASQEQNVAINMTQLRQSAVKFKISDGMVPVEKQMNVDEWQTAMQVLGSSPTLGAGYNIAPLFSYIMKLRGADLSPFEIDPVQQQITSQVNQIMGIVVPAIDAGKPPPTPDQLKQWSGLIEWMQQTQAAITASVQKQAQQQQKGAPQGGGGPQNNPPQSTGPRGA